VTKAVTKAAAPAPKAAAPAAKVAAAAAPAPAKAAPAPAKAAPAKAVAKPAAPIPYPFDAKFLDVQKAQLVEERAKLVGQADRLQAEADSLMQDLDPGDVQFDEESGEGDTIVVERGRDLALSAQARDTVNDIDAALARIEARTYGLSIISGKPIPKERLRAIPWATELVEEKVGGLGRR
jgi:RNA polymerase-binding transcription factor DksA